MRLRAVGYVIVLELLSYWGSLVLYLLGMTLLMTINGVEWGRQHYDPVVVFIIQLGVATGVGAWMGKRANCPDNKSFVYGAFGFAAITVFPYFKVLKLIGIVAVAGLLSRTAIRYRDRAVKPQGARPSNTQQSGIKN